MKIFHSAKTVLRVWGEHASIKDSVQTDCPIHLKDLCGDGSIILFLGITGSLAFRTTIAYSNHIPHEFSISTCWSSRHIIIWLLHHMLRNFQDGDHVERIKAKVVQFSFRYHGQVWLPKDDTSTGRQRNNVAIT